MHGCTVRDAVEGEQRLLAAGRAVLRAPLELLGEQLGDPRSVRNETALPELPAPDDEQVTGRVDVADSQSARLAGAQPESVAEREDRAVGRAPSWRSRVVAQPAGRVQQAPRLLLVEQERDLGRGRPPPAGPSAVRR